MRKTRSSGAPSRPSSPSAHGWRLSSGATYVKSVGLGARRMRGRVVERVEVVVDGLDLLPLEHCEAKTKKDVFQFAHRRCQHVQPADRLRRGAGQGDVERVRRQAYVELARVEQRRALLDQLLQLAPSNVCGFADQPALLGLQRGDTAQHLRQLGLASEIAHAQLLDGLAAGGRLRSPVALARSALRSARS